MLGEQIAEESGRVTGRRILPGDDYRYVKMEISFESTLTVLGMRGMNMGTYTVYERVPGQIYAEGQGIAMTEPARAPSGTGMASAGRPARAPA